MAEPVNNPVDIFSDATASAPQSSSSSSTIPIPNNFCPMVIIRHSSLNADLSIFPPSSHENLTPSSEIQPLPASPISPLSFPRSYSDPSSSAQFDSDPAGSSPQSPAASSCHSSEEHDLLPPSPLSAVPRWWRFAFQIIRSKFGNFRLLFGRKGELGNLGVAVAAATAMWWLWLRERRRRKLHRGDSVGQLVQIVREKDEV
ncbi:hypothetical protein LINPERHAP1_LOCUS20684 [Linum perenne]